jgi:acetoin utilization deacetylase AcuC-like enzyme
MYGSKGNTALVVSREYLEHKPGHTHPENPSRLSSVYRMIESVFAGSIPIIKPDLATLEQLELVHTPAYIKKVMKTAEHDFTSLAPDTPASQKTYHCAWLAVGGCIKAVDALLSGDFKACFALVRPPGHHALKDRAGGFCVFNNLAVAARYAATTHGCERILIIDWDIHHGNGIQDTFYSDRGVFYFSTHDPLLYPYTGAFEETGSGQGTGYNLNIHLPRDTSDKEILFLYRQVLTTLLERYQPQLILVAAGFDAHSEDPVGRSRLSAEVFGALTRLLIKTCTRAGDPPVLFSLEGGYNPQALSESVKETIKAMAGDHTLRTTEDRESDKVAGIIAKARGIHRQYGLWTN